MLPSQDGVLWWVMIGVCIPAGLFVAYLVFDAVRGYIIRRRSHRHRGPW